MKKRNTTWPLIILIILLLAVGIAFWRSASYQAASAGRHPVSTAAVARPKVWKNHTNQSVNLDTLKEQEFLGLEPTNNPALESSNEETTPTPKMADPVMGDSPALPSSKNMGRYPRSYRSGRQQPASGENGNGNIYQAANNVVQSGSSAQTGYSIRLDGPKGSSGLFMKDKQGNLPADEQTKQMLSPFLGGLTREQAAALDRSLNGLSSRIERAVLKAMLPKSKKDANIEKYLQRNYSDGAQTEKATGPFAGVFNQVAAQKADIMKSMGNAYGSAAAKEAGQVMDSYQNELASALSNSTGKTAEDVAKQAREITQKYNKKLEKVSKDRGLEKYRNDLQAKDNELLHGLEQSYGSEMAGKIAQLQQAALDQKMQLAQQRDLSYDDLQAKLAEIDFNRDSSMRNLLAENGYSLRSLDQLKRDEIQRDIDQERQAQEEGKSLPMPYVPSDKEIEKRESQIPSSQDLQKSLGPERAAVYEAFYAPYRQEVDKILRDTETSRDEKNEQLLRAHEKLQNQLQDPKTQDQLVDATLNQFVRESNLSRATSEQKEAFKEQARPILQQMYQEQIKISNSNLPDDEKKRQLEESRQRAMQRLSGGQ